MSINAKAKNLLNRIHSFLRSFWINQKTELFTILLVLLILLNNRFIWIPKINSDTIKICSNIDLNNVINALAIFIGIYITVLTILSTSVLGITKKLLKQKKDQSLLQTVAFGMGINILTIVFTLVFDDTSRWQCNFFFTLLVLSCVSFVKFIILMFLIFKGNINAMAPCIDEQETYQQNITDTLEQILEYLKKR